jgi:stage V sporulation protein SpoVS
MANILELKTKKGSEVMAKIAGTLSKANRISVNSMTTKAMNKGVAAVICLNMMKNF